MQPFPNLLATPLRVRDPLCDAVIAAGFDRLDQLAVHVQGLPYRRPLQQSHPLAVLREGCGTCSSKHLLLARVAQSSGRFDVMLTVGVYDMDEDNTPGVGQVLAKAGVPSLPEAHCYLTVDHQRLDFTGLPGGDVRSSARWCRSIFPARTHSSSARPRCTGRRSPTGRNGRACPPIRPGRCARPVSRPCPARTGRPESGTTELHSA